VERPRTAVRKEKAGERRGSPRSRTKMGDMTAIQQPVRRP
jgi:hypothetical protein